MHGPAAEGLFGCSMHLTSAVSRFDMLCAQSHWASSNRSLELCHWLLQVYEVLLVCTVAMTYYNSMSLYYEEFKSSAA